MYTLYGSKGSGSAAIEAALDRCDVTYKLVRAATWEPDSALAALERVNPLKQIPTLLLPDGSVMTESAAILIHLGLEFPQSDLLPMQPGRRAQALRGLVYIAANCYAAVSISDYPERWCDDASDTTINSVRSAARSQLHRQWEIFADLFPASPYFSGERPGALDFLAAVVSKWSGTRGHLTTARPQFLATLHAIEQHPDAATVFARHWSA